MDPVSLHVSVVNLKKSVAIFIYPPDSLGLIFSSLIQNYCAPDKVKWAPKTMGADKIHSK